MWIVSVPDCHHSCYGLLKTLSETGECAQKGECARPVAATVFGAELHKAECARTLSARMCSISRVCSNSPSSECVPTLSVPHVLELSKLLNVLELSQMSSKSWTVVGPVLGTKLYNAECSQTLKMSSKQMNVVKILNVFKVSCFPISNHKML